MCASTRSRNISQQADAQQNNASSDSTDANDDEAEDLRSIAEEGNEPLPISDQDALLEQLLSVRDPEMRPVDVRELETHEYVPIAPRTRWLRLHGVRGVELAIPQVWEAWVGEGTVFGIPYRVYHLAVSPPGALTTVALSVTLYKGAFNSPTLRSTQYSGALGVTQLLAQIHQVRA